MEPERTPVGFAAGLLGASRELFIVADTEMSIHSVRGTTLDALGREPSELRGRSLLDPPDLETRLAILRKIWSTLTISGTSLRCGGE